MSAIVNDLQHMLQDGFSEKFARFYLNALEHERTCSQYDVDFMQWAHSRGFLAEHASAYGLNESNYQQYLSDYDFYKSWPLNSWARIWVNDKLTLKHMLAGTEFEYLLPRYFYYSMPNGLRPSLDNHLPNPETFESFVQLLRAERHLACKPNNDALSNGFCHMECKNDLFYINGERVSLGDLERFVETHPNYVYQEYLRPSCEFHAITPLIHTLRILVINETGTAPRIARSYLRFPCKCTGEANFVSFSEGSGEVYLVYADVDEKTGNWGDGRLVYANKIQKAEFHPDSGAPLKGVIKDFDKLSYAVLAIARRFNTVEYMGFDIGVTDKGFRMMEINTHPGIGGFQYYRSMYSDPFVNAYFEKKLQSIDSLTAEQKIIRNKILR